jgi:type VI secretion system secreted protein Hcp
MQTKYRSTNRLLIAIFALGLFSASTLYGPAYMKLGDIKGESQSSEHEDEIDVLAYSWGMAREAISGGGAAGKAVFKEMTITKRMDKASPKLMEVSATGDTSRDAIITLTNSDGTGQQFAYLKITLGNVIVSSVSSNWGGDGRPVEEVTLNYNTIQFEYIPQLPDGSGDQPVTFAWDVEKNTPIDPAAGN